MSVFTILEAPSVLGLGPTGVEKLPEALLKAGLAERLRATHGGRVEPLAYSDVRGSDTQVLNTLSILEYTVRLSDKILPIIARGEFPLVLGGDCSILLGSMLALRQRGRYGLLFIDGHMDFYSPETSPSGEAADMDLALATGRGPDIITNVRGLSPLVRDADVVVLGHRDSDEAARDSAPELPASIAAFNLAHVRRVGAKNAACAAIEILARSELEGFWIHLDVDVLDDAVMPAVDYRMPDGLSLDELSCVLRIAVASGKSVGLEVTIFNPRLDPDGVAAHRLVSCIVSALRE